MFKQLTEFETLKQNRTGEGNANAKYRNDKNTT